MSEVQSAAGRVALRRLPQWVDARRRNASILSQAFADCSCLRIPTPPRQIYHSFYKYYAFVKPERLAPGWSRDRIVEEINAVGAPCFTGSCSEIYREQAFPAEWRPKRRHPVAQDLGDTSLMFLVHPTLSADAMQRYAAAAVAVCQRASLAFGRADDARQSDAA